MEKAELFKISRRNVEWFKENYEGLKREHDNYWIIIQKGQVVERASSFKEIMDIVHTKKYDPNSIIIEYMQSKQIAMFF